MDNVDTFDVEHVPDDPKQNAKWRAWILEECARADTYAESVVSKDLRDKVKELCRKDFWYWAKGFAFVHESRILDDDTDLVDLDTKVPFLPWPHQIPVVDHILKVLGKEDFRLVKSRAQGASWLMILIAVWLWLFHKGSKVNFVSKDEKAVDERGNMDSIFAKIQWLLPLLPHWMVGIQKKHWNRNYSDHTFTRMDGETAITGYACTPNVASGGRALVFFMDEHAKHPQPQDAQAMASTQPVTRCRGSLSTPWGMGGEFAKIIHDDTIEGPVLRLAWWDNPTNNRGLYRIVKGRPVAVDEEKYGPLPDDYLDHGKWTKLRARLEERGYDLTNKQYRSPWYDREALRQGASPVLMAQEYDMHFGASVSRYFSDALCNRLLNSARLASLRGEFFVDPESLTGKWTENPDGRFKLWCDLDVLRQPPLGEYIVACDISAGLGGSGGSNSSITVFDRRRGKKVLGFASPSVKPYQLAEMAIALCKWFPNYRGDPAFLIWENQGPGKEFCERVERSGFQHYYRRKSSKDAPLHSRHTDRPGFWMWKRSVVLGPYREALLEGHFENPDRDAIEELRQYQMGQDGEPYHVASKDKTDPSGAGTAHGDRVVSDGLAWRASLEFGDQHEGRAGGNKPNVMNPSGAAPNSFAWRREQYLKLKRKQKQKSNW